MNDIIAQIDQIEIERDRKMKCRNLLKEIEKVRDDNYIYLSSYVGISSLFDVGNILKLRRDNIILGTVSTEIRKLNKVMPPGICNYILTFLIGNIVTPQYYALYIELGAWGDVPYAERCFEWG